jgi:hypothetical protein
MISAAELEARLRRMEELSRGLEREAARWRAGDDPLLHAERAAYLAAIREASAGVEAARAALAGATRRMSKAQGADEDMT